jgi:hypothetical protein
MQGGKISWSNGALRVDRQGQVKKLVRQVERITFAADYARQRGQEVLYVTERAVFRLDPQGVRLVEVAPGIEVARDILPHMEFAPRRIRRRHDGSGLFPLAGGHTRSIICRGLFNSLATAPSGTAPHPSHGISLIGRRKIITLPR